MDFIQIRLTVEEICTIKIALHDIYGSKFELLENTTNNHLSIVFELNN